MFVPTLLSFLACTTPDAPSADGPAPPPTAGSATSPGTTSASPSATTTWSPSLAGIVAPTATLSTGLEPDGWVMPYVELLPRDDAPALLAVSLLGPEERAITAFLHADVPRGDSDAVQLWDGVSSYDGQVTPHVQDGQTWYWLEAWMHPVEVLSTEQRYPFVADGAYASIGPVGYPYGAPVERPVATGFDADGDGLDDLLAHGWYTSPYVRYGPIEGATTGGDGAPHDYFPSDGRPTTVLPDHVGPGLAAVVYGGEVDPWGDTSGAEVYGLFDDYPLLSTTPEGQTFEVRPLHDLDGDGDIDVVVSVDGAPAQVVAAPLDATLAPLRQVLDGELIASIGDVDGDGEPELLALGDDGLSRVLFSPHGDPIDALDGLPVEPLASADHLSAALDQLALGDLDGDGLGDLAYPEWPVDAAFPTGRIFLYTGHDLVATREARQAGAR